MNSQRRIRILIATTVAAIVMTASSAAMSDDSVIAKGHALLFFGMTRPEWEAYAIHAAGASTQIRLFRTQAGVALAVFDAATGNGLVIQPIFSTESALPEHLIVGSYYAKSALIDASTHQKITAERARLGLGSSFSVAARHAQLTPAFEGVELMITQIAAHP